MGCWALQCISPFTPRQGPCWGPPRRPNLRISAVLRVGSEKERKEKLACMQVELGKRKEPEGSLPPPPRLGPQPPQPSSVPPPGMRPTPAAGAGPQSLPPPPVMAPRPQAPPQLPPPALGPPQLAPPQMRPPAFGLPLPQRPPMMAGGLPPRPMVPGMPGAAPIISAVQTEAHVQHVIIHISLPDVHCQLEMLLTLQDDCGAS